MTERPDDAAESEIEFGTRESFAALVQQFSAFIAALWNSSGRRNFILLTVSIIMAMGSVASLILFLMLPERDGDDVMAGKA